MAERKRKRTVEATRSQKDHSSRPLADTIQIFIHEEETQWTPVIVSTPGLHLPPSTIFKPYTNRESKTLGLLHSESHPQLDYTASGSPSTGVGSHLTHYVGIYDPQQGNLELIPSKEMAVRSTLKSARTGFDDTKEDLEPVNYRAARQALGLAFGSKKTQKIIHNLTANAISPSKPSQAGSTGPPDPLAQAVLSSMPEGPSAEAVVSLEKAAEAARARPTPNLSASTPADVYPIPLLVGGEDTLPKLHVKDWIDTINSNGDVTTRSLYVSRRILRVVRSGDVRLVRVLRYLQLLIEWYKLFSAPKHKHKGRHVPDTGDQIFAPLIADFSSQLVGSVKARFADSAGNLNKWHQDNLITHMMALTLVVDNFETDTLHMQRDLVMDPKDLAKYYQELGCAVTIPNKAEQTKMKISSAEAKGRRMAKLKLPLKFPKPRGRFTRK